MRSSSKGRLLAVLGCGLAMFGLLFWRGQRQESRTFSPEQIISHSLSRLTREAGPVAEELSPQAEKSLAASTLPVYGLKMNPGDLRLLEAEPFGNTTYSATFLADGQVYNAVKVRVRGSWSRSWPKKSLKIIFDHKNPFQSHNSINLNSCWRDPSFIREALAYHMYAACGVIASRARMVRLQVNGHFHGLYVEIEQPGKEFLASHQLKGASLYKAASQTRDADERDLGGPGAYQGAYTKENKKTEGYDELAGFCHELARGPDTIQFFNQQMVLDDYINYLAATVLIQHWDGFNKNHFLAHDRNGSGKWLVIPWDLDRTFGDHWQMRFDVTRLPVLLGTRRFPGVTGWNRLEERFFSEPALRTRFLDRLSELLDKEFTTEKLFPLLDQLETQIAPAARLDRTLWPGPENDFHAGIAGVKSFIRQRRAFLRQQLPRLRQL